MSALHDLLTRYRTSAKTEREKGEYFELLAKDYFINDPVQSAQFDEIYTYSEWAELRDLDKRDTGIDLVAKLIGEDKFCAIQCKFYDEDYKVQKKDIDSFFTASGKAPFARRVIIDTTRQKWTEHAEGALDGQNIESTRIGLSDMEQSPIDWGHYANTQEITLEKKTLREHQIKALEAVENGLNKADRGKLIMACGTGKTFTSLKIAEEIAGAGGRVLYLVPSLSLMSQTVREWANDADLPLKLFAVCSDVQVGKRKAKDDLSDINIHDLAYPATTDAGKLAEKVTASFSAEKMTVVFSTYQSIQVISDAQSKHGLDDFDLIICDEAHRTTGATLAGEDESNFVKIHYQDYIKGRKRLYMTATPRIFSDAVKVKADEVDAELVSMDKPELFGETMHTISFSEAVQKKLLTDYKVIVLAVDESIVSAGVQKRLTDTDSQLVLDDATKIIGCYRALSKYDIQEEVIADADPMRRAVAFCRDIKSSKLVKNEFAAVVEEYLAEQGADGERLLNCEVDHVDGTFNAKTRTVLLDWLSANDDPQTCRILSNARCLSEGVDVPTLDAILFLHPRKSQVDVVQSVGRVMRRAPGKKMGYVILPVGVPAGVPADEALNNNEKYKVVWQILNALRAHDDRFDATINKASLGVDVSDHIEIIAVSNTLPVKAEPGPTGPDIGGGSTPGDDNERQPTVPPGAAQMPLVFDEFSKAIMAKIVKKCGTRDYWEDWANDIAKIAQTHITRITAVLKKPDSKERKAFDAFLAEIRDDLNESISEEDAIEMLAQHIITKPVFEVLFEDYSFTQNNPVSMAMQSILEVLQEQNLEKEAESLHKFYASVKMRAEGIDNAAAKQKIIVELYDKFFRNAFPRMTQKLGIVYTPVEVVDFIIHSINDILQKEFGQTLGSKGVHIIDPFVGTGTFITRLLQSGLIKPEELAHKYAHEIHANDIVLLAYYIAAINIEQVYHGLAGGEYKPFEGICLTDTFQLYEKDDLISELLVDNSSRRVRQKKLDIRVIMGNPPYSAGQGSANDSNANVAYPQLDETIRNTYAAHTTAVNKNALYDSYIRAIRWGSDRMGESGVMGYISSAGWVEGNAMNGLRKCLQEEFSNLYVFHLRGNQRTSGELSRKEGGKIFGSGSRAPIAITLFVKNQNATEHGKIYFHDIGDYLTQAEKLSIVKAFKSISGIADQSSWLPITPDKYDDWLNQRDDSFDEFILIGEKKDKKAKTIFEGYSSGLQTNRDFWCYNSSKLAVEKNMSSMVNFYNSEVDRFSQAKNQGKKPEAEEFIDKDLSKIKWSSSLVPKLEKGVIATFSSSAVGQSIYRPFSKEWVYYDRMFNHRVYQMPQVFPNAEVVNRVIWSTGTGASLDYTCFMSNVLPDLQGPAKIQCFPLKLYEKLEEDAAGLFAGCESACKSDPLRWVMSK